ncbi:helix-turn-helix transcriptional regulator [Pseudophaeobacter arcticus]|uniref:Helix-turn-helix transcriptional regulator n=1 Tax=Pseudophaeobacter arcticus TaxID=385492 RepID=A0ABQ0ALY4_9RHOB
MQSYFAQNLRWLCAEAGPIAQTCRGIGINRQQFNRYLSGGGAPSAHNLRRISKYFALTEAELLAPHDEFCAAQGARLDKAALAANPSLLPFNRLFQNQARPLRRFLGVYHAYYCTPTWPGQILRSLIQLRAEDGLVVTHTYERATSGDGSIRQRSRYHGLASFQGNRLCMYETHRRAGGFLSETVLMPEHPQQTTYLQGLTLGVSARPDQQPFSTRTVWVRISERTSAREALALTGAYPSTSVRLDPKVRRLLGDQPPISITPEP